MEGERGVAWRAAEGGKAGVRRGLEETLGEEGREGSGVGESAAEESESNVGRLRCSGGQETSGQAST